MTVEFTVPGEPVGKGRPRFVRATGRTYTPEKTARFENLVKMAFTNAKPEGFAPFGKDTPLEITIKSKFAPPESASKKKRSAMIMGEIYPTKIPDLDNAIKIIMDGLHDVCYTNDSCVVRVIAEKRYSIVPETVVTVREIEGENSLK